MKLNFHILRILYIIILKKKRNRFKFKTIIVFSLWWN